MSHDSPEKPQSVASGIPPTGGAPEMRPRRAASGYCRVCLGAHNDETHDATLSVHGWFREEVTKHFVYLSPC